MILAVRNGKKAEYLKNKIKKIGRKAIVIEFDVTKKETIKSLVDLLVILYAGTNELIG